MSIILRYARDDGKKKVEYLWSVEEAHRKIAHLLQEGNLLSCTLDMHGERATIVLGKETA